MQYILLWNTMIISASTPINLTMRIELNKIKPNYMSDSEVSGSDIYLQPQVIFERGRKYMVRAKSGQGKTSLLNFIYGNSTEFNGTINYHEQATDTFNFRRNKLSYMFQDLCLFPDLTAVENVRIKNLMTNHKSDAEIDAMFYEVLLSEKKTQPAKTLSLGQLQRVAAIRALCQPFEFLLLDEPFSHLDYETATRVAQMINKEVERQGAGLIVTALDETDLFVFDKVLNL